MGHSVSLDSKPAKVLAVGFAVNDFYEGLSRRIKSGQLKLTSLSTPTRLSLMHYDAAKRAHEALRQ